MILDLVLMMIIITILDEILFLLSKINKFVFSLKFNKKKKNEKFRNFKIKGTRIYF